MPAIPKIILTAAALCVSCATFADGHKQYLYTLTNNIKAHENSVAQYQRLSDGSLRFVKFYKTNGTGINNDTHGKLGPQDNDSQIIISGNRKHLYAVNTHSNDISGFSIEQDGTLTELPGSPFPSKGIAPVSINISGNILVAANRNEDYHQKASLADPDGASYTSFKIQQNGTLVHADTLKVPGFQKPAQIHASQTVKNLFFADEFQVDADFDGDGTRSFLAGPKTSVQGQIKTLKVDDNGKITVVNETTLPETIEDYLYMGMPGVPSMPLGLWSHPSRNLLYAGFVTRNQLGVFSHDDSGSLKFVNAVTNGGQDICWILVNKQATRLYTVNNLPRQGTPQTASTLSVYDISGENALSPLELQVLEVPMPGESFINNRNLKQPGSTSFEVALSPAEDFLYVINQRINQTKENTNESGNAIHSFAVDKDGLLKFVSSAELLKDGFPSNSRAQGLVTVDL
ncbi:MULTISPECIES: lactonase family protein [Pseudomonas]|uniref:lactonase family protein n=1 Tax=Pseudomonas TaxID=286 RepID=UPI002DB73ABD|nr:beta-propeller fold lactonase family protein [Pseudomonas asiatica]MEB6587990.1 beta-propeller fold lactonase family protein [Pseudomonas asiatica]